MIASDFDAFCQQHGITYYMMGGTALGAMRHGGFIPWDDDYDVFMDRANYDRLAHIAPELLDKEKYYFQAGGTEEWPLYFSKLRLNGTRLKEGNNEGRQMHEGIYIDIMCLNSTFENRHLRYIQFSAARLLTAYALAKRGYETNSKAKLFGMRLARAIGFAPVRWVLMKIARGFERDSSKLVGHFFGRAKFPATTFERRYLGTPRMVAFEQYQLPVAEKVEAYLTVRFGPNYMDPPSDEVRAMYPSHAEEVEFGPWGRSADGQTTGGE